jgi:hypothetical protein
MSRKRVNQPQVDAGEKGAYRRLLRMLKEGGRSLEGATEFSNQLTPQFLDQAGLEYDLGPDQSADYRRVTGERDSLIRQLAGVKGMSKSERRSLRSQLQESGAIDARKGPKTKLRASLRRAIRSKDDQAATLNQGRTISNIREGAAAKAARLADEQNLATAQQRFSQAMSGNLPDILSGDSALARQIEKERSLRAEAIRRQLGTSGEVSATGQQQVADFERNAYDATSANARQNIGMYGQLSLAQGAQNLQSAGARQQLQSFAPEMRAQNAARIGQYGQLYMNPLSYRQGNRQLGMQAALFNAQQPTTTDYVLKGIGSLFSGLKGSSD